jgi:hypothetical protein
MPASNQRGGDGFQPGRERDDDELQRGRYRNVKWNLGHYALLGVSLSDWITHAPPAMAALKHGDDHELPSDKPEIVPV